MSTIFVVEGAFLKSHLKKWIKEGHKGKWVIIEKTTCHGFRRSYHQAKKLAKEKKDQGKLKPPVLIVRVTDGKSTPRSIWGGITRALEVNKKRKK